ncbi:MAG: hypothetical protein RSC09_03000, partial [Clostridia bacterium]
EKNKKIGSATVMVLFVALVFSIYSSTSIAEVLSAISIQSKIEKKIKNTYGKDLQRIEEVYIEAEDRLSEE